MTKYSVKIILLLMVCHLTGLSAAHAEDLNICDRGRIGEIIARQVRATCDRVPTEKLKDIWEILILGDEKLTWLPRGAFKDLPSLKTVELWNTQIKRLEPDTFEGTVNLWRFTMKGAPLTEIRPGAFRGLDNVWSINIDGTKLKNIRAGTFEGVAPDLLAIDLRNNEIESIDADAFRDVFLVHSIYLMKNRIKKISSKTFFNLPNLMTIQLSENEISELETDAFNDLPELRELKLDENKISVISSEMFKRLPKLDTLKLSRNTITTIPKYTFEGARQLNALYLSKNQIRKIEPFAFSGAAIKTLTLCGNHDINTEDLQYPFSGLFKDTRIHWYSCWD